MDHHVIDWFIFTRFHITQWTFAIESPFFMRFDVLCESFWLENVNIWDLRLTTMGRGV